MSGPTFEEVKEVVDQQTCPECGGGRLNLERELVAKPIGTYSLAGQQMKLTTTTEWVARCGLCAAAFTIERARYDD